MKKSLDIAKEFPLLEKFIPRSQRALIQELSKGEERAFFWEKAKELHSIIRDMPQIYQQDGMGENAIVSLHYFAGGSDWFIMEREPDNESQHQVFGYVVLNGDLEYAELGYISLPELLQLEVSLDLHFEPRTLKEVKAELRSHLGSEVGEALGSGQEDITPRF